MSESPEQRKTPYSLYEGMGSKKELILNTLNFFMRGRKALPKSERLFVFAAFTLLGEEIPHKQEIIQELNSTQSDEGTWKKGHEHYVPITAQTFLFYKWIGYAPEKSLEPFLATIDTWRKAVAHNERYQPDNYWGGLWGYVACYTALGKQPPWKQEFLQEANGQFDSWASENHQRAHVIDCFRQLHEPIPRAEELTRIILDQQREDGRWESAHWDVALPQTAFGIFSLQALNDQFSPATEDALRRAHEFIDSCFTTVNYHGKEYGGYAAEPGGIIPQPIETACAIAAQLHPDELKKIHGV